MIYLDANVFLNAILNREEEGEKARSIIQKLQKGEMAAACALSFDEVFWIVKKHRDFNKALRASKALLQTPNLTFLKVDDETLWSALSLAEKYRLAPRDAIHLACALNNGISTIISEDEDFDKIKEIKRTKILDFYPTNDTANPTTHCN
jgi:predicted nucleic acid-binding protein